MSTVPADLALALRLGGEMGSRVATFDWDGHPFGPMGEWPEWMRTSVSTALLSRFPTVLWFGRDLRLVYNDGYRTMLGDKHPDALGGAGEEVWWEIWPTIGPMLHQVLDSGVATWSDDQLLVLERAGYREEGYFTFTYSPIVGGTGAVEGIFCAVNETTEKVVGERRLRTLRELADELNEAVAVPEVATRAIEVLTRNPVDLPYVGIYLPEGESGARLAAGTIGHSVLEVLPAAVNLDRDEVGRVLRACPYAGPEVLDGGADRQAVAIAIDGPGIHGCAGWLVAGVNPERRLDDAYRSFYELVASQIATVITRARAHELERRQTEELAQLDRAKTLFFSNVSHEFRTPLTLLLGPVEEALTDEASPLSESQRARLEIARRNAMRLLRLVNSLLDFSRVEAGRVDATFEPVDIVGLTRDVASVFQGPIEQAGVSFRITGEPPSEPVFVDVAMWEKIVLNLLSNAFKFTFEGTISIDIREADRGVVVSVSDTGVGIPEEQLPLVFERFHRVSGLQGRSHEGTGIGLSLVRELAEAHGGTIEATSEVGRGSSFSIRLPLGSEHLPAEAVGEGNGGIGQTGAQFVEEALRWLPDEMSTPSEPSRSREHILVVDDNADMRSYLGHLLRGRYRVTTAGDGEQALELIRREPPDLVLSDVMMPNVDGLELVHRIREAGGLDLPVLLLSARAGADAAVEALDVGADDYLVKPFSTDELLGRVQARLAAGKARRLRQTLSRLAAGLSTATGFDEVVKEVHACLRLELGVDATSLALVERDRDALRYWHATDDDDGGVAARYHLLAMDDPSSPALAVIREGKPMVIQRRTEQEPRFAAIAPDLEEAGVEGAVLVPLVRVTGDATGCLLSSWKHEREVPAADVELVEAVARTTHEAIERVRISELEHRLIEQFQERLLRVDQRAPVAALASRYRPTDKALLLGGDWYDVLTLDDGALGISIGDVVGKGLPAATVMSQLRSAVEVIARTTDVPSTVVERVDAYAERLPDAVGSTLLYLLLEPDGSVDWCAAGHLPPLVLRDGHATYLDGPQRGPLASRVVAPNGHVQAKLEPAALLLLFTDGLVERRGEVIDTGLERLALAVEEHGHLPVLDLCDALLAVMSPAEGGFHDDIALVAARMTGSNGQQFVDAFDGGIPDLAAARARLRAWLSSVDVQGEESEAVILAIGEAVANAVEHGCDGSARSVITVEASVRDGRLIAAVNDTGRWSESSTGGPSEDRGRGFTIMKSLMDEVTVRRSRLGTSVRLDLALGQKTGPPTAS